MTATQTEIYVGETSQISFNPGHDSFGNNYHSVSFTWSNVGGSNGSVQFLDPQSGACDPYVTPMTSTFPGCGTGVTARGDKVGTVTVQCTTVGDSATLQHLRPARAGPE